MSDVAAVILAAGVGKRMKSKLPKVLHPVCGRPMVGHVIRAAQSAGATRTILVVSPDVENFADVIKDSSEFCVQRERLGTGHAVMQAQDILHGFHGEVLVLLGDMPLLPASQLQKLMRAHRNSENAATVLTAVVDDPTGYGRIIRDNADGPVLYIKEHRDATEAELSINEINTGVFCFDCRQLLSALAELKPDNDQNEYYLTDVVGILRGKGLAVGAVVCDRPEFGMGINSRKQLAEAAQVMRSRVCERLMDDGVTIVDPSTTYIDATALIGPDTTIQPMTFIEGSTQIGEDCIIGPGTRLKDVIVGNRTSITNSIVVESSIGDDCNVGPFSYIRPGTILHEGVKVGDFVELKKAEVRKGSKVPHLSYVGDAIIGENVNIGCGTITCNYDGKHKHRTVVGDGAFIGSNTNLVAPVTVGNDALVAAGSTITRDVPPDALAVARARQENKEGWSARLERRREATESPAGE